VNWKIKKFDELTTKELYEILKVRAEVFVVEQDCVYQDLDLKDEDAYHLFGENQGEVICYLRILPKGAVYHEVAIGRVLTKQTYRKKGLSRELVKKAINYIISDIAENEIRISAQAYLLRFYESFGFKKTSEIYLEDGIEHVEMLYKR
jgi:ElaA protein